MGDHGWEDRIAISTESVRPNWWPPNSLCLWPQQPSQGNSTDAYCHQAVCRLAAPAGPPTKGPFPTCSDLTAPLPLNAFRKVKSDSPAFPHRSPLDQRKAEPLERESGIPCTSVLEATLRLTLRHLGKSRFLKESWPAFGRMNSWGKVSWGSSHRGWGTFTQSCVSLTLASMTPLWLCPPSTWHLRLCSTPLESRSFLKHPLWLHFVGPTGQQMEGPFRSTHTAVKHQSKPRPRDSPPSSEAP